METIRQGLTAAEMLNTQRVLKLVCVCGGNDFKSIHEFVKHRNKCRRFKAKVLEMENYGKCYENDTNE